MKNIESLTLEPHEVVTYMRVGSPAQIGKVIAYARCAAQDDDGQELGRRTAETLAVAAAHGLEVEAENIIAEYGSGSDIAGRSGLTALLNEVENGKVGALVVTSLDRLWRNSDTASRLSDALVSHGVTVVTAYHVFHLARAEDAARWRWCGTLTRITGSSAARGQCVARVKRGEERGQPQ